MKRLSLILILTLVGCGSGVQEAAQSTPIITEQSTPRITEAEARRICRNWLFSNSALPPLAPETILRVEAVVDNTFFLVRQAQADGAAESASRLGAVDHCTELATRPEIFLGCKSCWFSVIDFYYGQ